MKPKVLIITGYGVNCEAESKFAWEMAGAECAAVHLNDLLEKPEQLQDFNAVDVYRRILLRRPYDKRSRFCRSR